LLVCLLRSLCASSPFSSTYPAITEIYTLSLHDALPIFLRGRGQHRENHWGHQRGTVAARPNGPPQRREGKRGSAGRARAGVPGRDRKSTRLNSSHVSISYAVFCLKKKKSPHAKQRQDVE